MALNGSKKYSHNDGWGSYSLEFSWERVSYNIARNTSTIEWEIKLKTTGTSWFSSSSQPYYIKIDNTEYRGNVNVGIGMNETRTLVRGQTIINHNKDGTKTFTCIFSQTFSSSLKIEEQGTFTLDKIPQPSSVICTTTSIGSELLITIKPYDDNYTHTLSYGFGNQELGYITGVIAEKTTATQIKDFVWPQTFYQVIPNSTSGKGSLFCETYNGNELIGTTTHEFTALVNKHASTPTISPIIKDSNATTIALTGDSDKLVRYFSTASITINAEAKNYATIASQKAMCGTNYFTTPTGAIGNVQSHNFLFEAIDSRGYKTSVGRDLKTAGRFVEYYLPTCTIENNTIDTAGNTTVSCSGTWFNGSFGAVNNSLTAQYRYKVKDGSWSNWVTMSVSSSLTTDEVEYTATADLSGLDYRNTYIFEARVTDKLITVTSAESSAVSLPIFHWSKEDFAFEVPVTFKQGIEGNGTSLDIENDTNINGGLVVEGDANIKGNLRLKGAGNYGNTIYFGDGSYVSVSEATDDKLTFKADNGINFDTTNLMLRDYKIDYGNWTPKLAATAAVVSYSAQYGWYQRVGKAVTIGFQIKANINSGYHATGITITGLPFTPLYSASGGGICSGAYVSAGFNFQCWAVNSDSSTITGRVQACNNTSAGNLNTSASGVFYRSGGGEVTLGGTITYITNS